jgi:hypothetical protein
MLQLLALVGLTLEKGTATIELENGVRAHLEYYLAVLAEAEHDGWMTWHMAQGWCYATVRDDVAKQHNCLVPYTKLSDKDKGKDREAIRHYPDFARKAKMKIVFIDA